METDLLFVYGTLRKGGSRQLDANFRDAEFIGEALFNGALFVIANDSQVGPYPGVVLCGDNGGKVVGDVFRLADPKEDLAKLDEYEECADGFPEPWEYVREVLNVTLASGSQIRAWVYLFNRPTDKLEFVESGDFLRYLKSEEPGTMHDK